MHAHLLETFVKMTLLCDDHISLLHLDPKICIDRLNSVLFHSTD
jgi:hypothetical protein